MAAVLTPIKELNDIGTFTIQGLVTYKHPLQVPDEGQCNFYFVIEDDSFDIIVTVWDNAFDAFFAEDD